MGKFKQNLLILYLALSNIVWFYNFTLGTIKEVLFVAIFILFIIDVMKYKGIFKYLSIYLFFTIIILLDYFLLPHSKSYNLLYNLFGIFENFFLFSIGLVFSSKEIAYDDSLFKKIIYILIPFLLIVALNFFTGVPDWHSPLYLEHNKELQEAGNFDGVLLPLYSSGFGMARTGWATTLCQFLPLGLVLMNKKFKIGTFFLILISFCIIISGSRGGLFSMLIILLLAFIKNTKKEKYVYLLLGIFAVLVVIMFTSWDYIAKLLRLTGSTDFSSGRLSQYLIVPEMISESKLHGLGLGKVYDFMRNYGYVNTLHNVYLRLPIECGIIFTIGFYILVFYVIKILVKTYKKGNGELYVLSLVLLSSLLSGLTEPQSCFGTVNWWSFWWFVFGALVDSFKNNRAIFLNHNNYENNNYS